MGLPLWGEDYDLASELMFRRYYYDNCYGLNGCWSDERWWAWLTARLYFLRHILYTQHPPLEVGGRALEAVVGRVVMLFPFPTRL